MKARTVVLMMLAIVGPGSVAWAHHSFGMFDSSTEVTLEGIVKDFQWTNPHTWIQLMVKDPTTGELREWGIEGSPTTSLKRRGWNKESIKVGAKALITIHPLRSGAQGGSLVKAEIDGKPVGSDTPG